MSPPPPRSTPSHFLASYPTEHVVPKPAFPPSPFVLTLHTRAFVSDLGETVKSASVSETFLKDGPVRIQRGQRTPCLEAFSPQTHPRNLPFTPTAPTSTLPHPHTRTHAHTH